MKLIFAIRASNVMVERNWDKMTCEVFDVLLLQKEISYLAICEICGIIEYVL